MKTVNILRTILALAGIAAACCGAKSSTSCCGKGKCNIFCCNCDGGCKSYEDCCRATCGLGCIKGGEMPLICATICRKRCTERSRELGEPPESPFADIDLVDETWLAMSDDQMFEAVRTDDKNHFTYKEFLKQRTWEDSPDAREFFDRFDRNGDGVITVDEMREPGVNENPNQDQNPTQKPGTTTTTEKDEL